MKKKLTCLLLAMAMVFSLTACGSGGDSSGGESAEGQTYEWTASSGLAVGSSWDLGLLKFAELLNERSNGAITLTVHSGATLGSAKETLEGVQMGSIDFIVESSASLSNFTDAMSVFEASQESGGSEGNACPVHRQPPAGGCVQRTGRYARGSGLG